MMVKSQTERLQIMMVDDEPAITESLSYSLKTAGFEPIAVGDLSTASKTLANTQDIALVILDLSLPDGHGFDWLKELRQRSSIPVIILSSHDDEIEHIVGLEIGADDFIDKPFSPREVVARVRAVLRRSQTKNNEQASEDLLGSSSVKTQSEVEQEADLASHSINQQANQATSDQKIGLVIDYLQYNVFFNGKSLALSQLEFALFEALYFEQRVHTRAQLLKKAWGNGVLVSERTVDVHMTSLRKKWAEFDACELIETVRGVGYKLASNLPPITVKGQPIK